MNLQVALPTQIEPEIRRYICYRAFLCDWFAFKKAQRRGFSYRRFSSLLGLKSPNFLQLVIGGEWGFSPPLAAKVCRLIGFAAPERAYFLSLVRCAAARTDREKEDAERWRRVSLRKLLTTPMEKVHAEVLGRWHHMLVRELVFLPDFEASGEYVSRRLGGLITEEEGAESLRLLKRGGFLVEKDGRLQAASPVLDSGNAVFTHELMQKHHGETLVTWGKHLGDLPAQEQELGLLHIPINSEKIPELKARIRRFQDEIIGWLESEQSPDRLVQLGTYVVAYPGSETEH